MKYIARIGARAAALMPLLLWGSLALAQTTTDLGTTTGSTTPGTPNTGVGGDVATMLLLLCASALIAVIGVVYLARQSRIGG